MKQHLNRLLLPVFAGLLLAIAPLAQAQYSIEWYTIDGGGGTSSGGNYTLTGTIGQPDAGSLSGGTYTVEGGFWGGVFVVQEPGLPPLRIEQGATGNTVVLRWLKASGGTLQSTLTLNPISWSDWGTAPVADGADNTVTVDASGTMLYFKLRP